MAGLYRKTGLLLGLLTGERAHTGPFYVSVDLTRRCNLRCLGCRYHSLAVHIPSVGDQAVTDFPFESFGKLCAELEHFGTNEIILQGEGEPFLHPRLMDVISTAKKAGLKVSVLTNGTLINEERAHSLIKTGLDVLKVSCWAASVENFEKNYPGTDSSNFGKIIDGLKCMAQIKAGKKSLRPKVILHHPISTQNFRQIGSFVDLAMRTHVDALSFSCLRFTRQGLLHYALGGEDVDVLRALFFRMKKKLKSSALGHNIDEVLLRYRMGPDVWEHVPCYVPWIHVRIKVDGTVLVCDQSSIILGNVNGKPFREIWNDAPLCSLRRKIMTRQGLASMRTYGDCSYCCFLKDNIRVHRLFKWFRPYEPPRS